MIDDLLRTLAETGTVTFAVHVRAGARITLMTGVLQDGTIKISVHAPPEGGKANAELFRLLADKFQVELRNVELISGAASPRKLIRISR